MRGFIGAEVLKMLETAKMAETAEELNRELDEILELNWLAIDAHWEIEALEWSRDSRSIESWLRRLRGSDWRKTGNTRGWLGGSRS